MEVTSSTKTIQQCFLECLYEVPNFQRPYSWEDDQLEDYWNDVALARGDFFFGTTVTWISAEINLFRKKFSLIDGQQRLTTSAVALSVVRDLFEIIETSPDPGNDGETRGLAHEQKKNTQKYLVAKDDNSKEYPVITRPEPMFWEAIQKPAAIPSGAKWDASAKLVGKARTFFEKKAINELETLSDTNSKVERLKALRNNILQARVIQVELKSEEDAFLIFETLNTRGADLRLTDLLKNMLVRGLSPDPRDRDAVASRWKTVVGNAASRDDNQAEADRFIWQSWNSRRDAVKEPELYKEIKSLMSDGKLTHSGYLAEVETDSQIFRHFDTSRFEFPKTSLGLRQGLAIPEVQDSIQALELFNVTVANSAIIALIRKFNQTSLISEKQLKRAVRSIENFHFQFTAMANGGSTGGTRGRYNRFSVALENSTTQADVDKTINNFTLRLKDSLPDRALVVREFTKLAYAPKLKLTAAQRKRGSSDLIRYVLITIAKHLGNVPSPQDTSGWTIEHIVPQRGAGNSFSDPVFSIGNLVLLSAKVNSGLGHGSLANKRTLLQSSACPQDASLVEWMEGEDGFEPSVKSIKDRATALANLAFNSVWLVR
ncbi:uncharacterized protein with ParB-like and HNH nuclease domain [Rhodococcus sp. SMB37]|uniref:DUF262 domain-containing protein n=1 Tax=Rhodococcus sp. SMB37 TaxID=2512213 RepID=UPI001044724F|nr:DUF262 domain-containing protein [Rhodococcus sp. SMB37]TCN53510.1 uncharacterized protein with ParB-like and HNH nuclease domain [Rhodococcus sp. SMB37]